jgi:NHLM bacteriocin system ABC transporter peptidase/ATP-binding protein
LEKIDNFMPEENKRVWSETRVKTPTVLQMEAVECGAAALAMILAYHGYFVPLEELRIACGVSRDGSKASNMLKAARNLGMKAQGFRMEPEELKELPLPIIVFWNFNHFVVLEGIKDGKAYLNDPADGPRAVPMEEFNGSFTGIALSIIPGPDFKKGGERPNIFVSLRNRLQGHGAALTYVFLAGLFLVIPGLVVPTFSRIFVDEILVKNMKGWAKPLFFGMAVTAVIMGALTYLQSLYLRRLETKIALSGSAKFLMHVLRLPMEFFGQRFAGEIAARVQINDRVAKLMGGELANNMLNVVMILFYALLMFQYDVILTLMGMAAAFLNVGLLRFVSQKRTNLNMRLQQEMGKLVGVSASGLQIIETLKASGSESDFFAQWAGQQAKVINAQQSFGLSSQLLSLVPTFLTAFIAAAVLVVGGLRVMGGHLTMGMLVAFQGLMASFLQPVNQMVNLGGKFQETRADLNRLDDVLKYPEDPIFHPVVFGPEEIQPDAVKLTGRLELRNVTFGYSRLEKPLIENFNLSLQPGARVALIGGSGSGKSTVAKLVSGLYRPWSGEILFDGKRLDELPRQLFCNSLALVDQDIFQFAGTVKENMTMWDATMPESEMVQAAKDASIHSDITERPGGYSALVEEGGANFSGGQRQRIEIARALANNPTILIMDEATSALDPGTETSVDQNLRRRGCTCLIIAHRLSTIRDCDEIIVLDRGNVVERGTHDELIKNQGLYTELIKAT